MRVYKLAPIAHVVEAAMHIPMQCFAGRNGSRGSCGVSGEVVADVRHRSMQVIKIRRRERTGTVTCRMSGAWQWKGITRGHRYRESARAVRVYRKGFTYGLDCIVEMRL